MGFIWNIFGNVASNVASTAIEVASKIAPTTTETIISGISGPVIEDILKDLSEDVITGILQSPTLVALYKENLPRIIGTVWYRYIVPMLLVMVFCVIVLYCLYSYRIVAFFVKLTYPFLRHTYKAMYRFVASAVKQPESPYYGLPGYTIEGIPSYLRGTGKMYPAGALGNPLK
ncbi:putative integral membrane protein [Babesia bovis T2Bo]|uniref:Uncharacterized protein n=1 Tax=Babesia bovis TaxID=5865 RepID=A7AMF6_BABBO|nr:putative integral membrane protein [Babesia bovis T2Bo]EDO07740.1 putative integral membrane protein [Babesia bovis T2Bo]|eukprot:XP_001611308.1 hypothetical protein [Babesia bovis T2Bo]